MTQHTTQQPKRAGTTRRLAMFAAAEWHGLRRDKVALFSVIALPLIITFVLGAAFSESGFSRVKLGLTVADEQGIARALTTLLEADDRLDIERYHNVEDLRKAVRGNKVQAGLALPAGFAAQDRDTTPTKKETGSSAILMADLDGGTGMLAESIIRAGLAKVVRAELVPLVVAQETGVSPKETRRAAKALTDQEGEERVHVTVRTTTGDESPMGWDRAAYTVVGMFMIISGLSSAGTVVALRRMGIARRILTTSASNLELISGILLSRFLLLFGTGFFLITTTAVLFGVDWGNIFAALAITAALCLFSAGAVTVMGTFFTTAEQATAIGPPVGIAIGMMSGAMWPLEITPVPMQVLGRLSPLSWAIDAYTETVEYKAGMVDVLGEIVIIVAFAAATIAYGTYRLRRAFGGTS